MPHVSVNGTTLNYRFDGTMGRDVVMFSHSLAADLTMWDAQIPPLVEAGYRVLRYDTRGHGRSAVPAGPYTMDLLAADAVGLMTALGLEKVHFCGLSLGGMIGQILGARHGNRLMSLILCSTAAFVPNPEIRDARIARVRAQGMEAVADTTVDRWFTKAGWKRLPGEVEKTRRMILDTSGEGYCACSAAIRDMDLRDSLRAIAAPTLVMVGENDQGTPVSAAELIHGGIASSELRIISAAAHFCNVEQREVFNRTLLNFIRREEG